MLLSENSQIRKPPKKLFPGQVVVFDAIRYSLDICDISFKRLKTNLYEMGLQEGEIGSSFPDVFGDVWTIIQHLTIFQKLIKTHFKIPLSDPLYNCLRDVIHLRNTHQHIDERITEVFTKKDLPIYGTLSWYTQKEMNTNDGFISILYSGSITHQKVITFKPVNPVGKQKADLVSQIEFTGIGRKETGYQEITITIDELMMNVSGIVAFFEAQMDEQTKGEDLGDRHTTDFGMWLKLGPATQEDNNNNSNEVS